MTKGKTFTYVLIACVVGVWGLIIYRVFAGLNEGEELLPITVSAKVPYFKMVDHAEDKYELDLQYRNPFSGSENAYDVEPKAANVQRSVVQPVSAAKQEVRKPEVNWSSVQYVGYVNNADSRQRKALVSINGNSVVLGEGQGAHGLKLLKNLGDSLKVQFQGETKFIKIR